MVPVAPRLREMTAPSPVCTTVLDPDFWCHQGVQPARVEGAEIHLSAEVHAVWRLLPEGGYFDFLKMDPAPNLHTQKCQVRQQWLLLPLGETRLPAP